MGIGDNISNFDKIILKDLVDNIKEKLCQFIINKFIKMKIKIQLNITFLSQNSSLNNFIIY